MATLGKTLFVTAGFGLCVWGGSKLNWHAAEIEYHPNNSAGSSVTAGCNAAGTPDIVTLVERPFRGAARQSTVEKCATIMPPPRQG